jgi:hypothetical protein
VTAVRDALVAVAALPAPDVPEVAGRAAAAHDDPGAHPAAHTDQLDERGIDEPIPELAWIALVDALADHDLPAEVDWREAADETVGRLQALRSAPPGEAWTGLVLLSADRAGELEGRPGSRRPC